MLLELVLGPPLAHTVPRSLLAARPWAQGRPLQRRLRGAGSLFLCLAIANGGKASILKPLT